MIVFLANMRVTQAQINSGLHNIFVPGGHKIFVESGCSNQHQMFVPFNFFRVVYAKVMTVFEFDLFLYFVSYLVIHVSLSILLFQGNQYWCFISTSMESGYPRDISQLGLPADIDSAFVWSGNGRIYFTKGKVRSDHLKYSKGLPVW